MCLQISQFCSGSAKPLLFAGGLFSLLLAIAIGYTGCTSHALLGDINPKVAQETLSYYLQLATAGYLTLIALFSCYAAHYDQKHLIRALAIVSTLNLVLVLAAILMMPPRDDISKPFIETLKQASEKYERNNKVPETTTQRPPEASKPEMVETSSAKPRARRYAEDGKSLDTQPNDLTKDEATLIWDRLQARGCCGLTNGTADWKTSIPKSCCDHPSDNGKQTICNEIDENHKRGCAALIESTSLNLFIVLALIAVVNLYLATISGISAYRTFHYNEASQSAYT